MGRWRWVLATLITALVSAGTAAAGVYNPGEVDELYPDFLSPPGRNFHEVVYTLRSISMPNPQVDKPMRRRFVFQEELLKKTPFANLKTVEDRLQASAVLIRRRKFKEGEAEQVLRPIAMQESQLDNIPVQSNFATTLHLSGDLQKAIDTLSQIVARWKEKQWDELPEDRRLFLERIGWSQRDYEFYRDCDTAYLKLLRLRRREQRAKKDARGRLQPPHALLADARDPSKPVRFVSDSGEYTAGHIPGQLPKNALSIVQQLVFWLPDDPRLYWLLGDVYNAQGSETDKGNRSGILAAHQIFKELSIEPATEEAKEQLKRRMAALSLEVERIQRERESDLTAGLNDQDKKDAGIPLDWRTVGVSFGTGVLLTLGAIWQVREIQRRRHAAQAKQQSRSA